MNAKRERFAREYTKDRNATKAAERSGYSPKTARQQGSRLLTNVDVRARVDELIAGQLERVDADADRIYHEMANVAFSNMRDHARWGPDGVELFNSGENPRHADACVAEVSQTVTQHGGTIRLKLHDKLGALTMLAKLKGFDPDDTPEARAQAIRDAIAELDDFTFVDPPDDE